MAKDHITVCICTFKRPTLLKRLLSELSRQKTSNDFEYSIVVVDNDRSESAKEVVTGFANDSGIETKYCLEPTPNIAMARNRAVNNASGNYVAFIDDDEFPCQEWLKVMLKTIKHYQVAGVLGPVLPHFDAVPPKWLTKAGFYDRARHETGFILGWREARTGNVLLDRLIVKGETEVFKPEFGSQGEDQDFFRRKMELGHRFIWCDEGPAFETVPPHRWKRRFLLHRALLRGHTTYKHRKDLLRNIGKSILAVPAYAIALPFLLVAGHHFFMKYLVRLCDHLGRLLAVLNLNPVRERSN